LGGFYTTLDLEVWGAGDALQGKSRKLSKKWTVPCEIVEVLSPQ